MWTSLLVTGDYSRKCVVGHQVQYVIVPSYPFFASSYFPVQNFYVPKACTKFNVVRDDMGVHNRSRWIVDKLGAQVVDGPFIAFGAVCVEVDATLDSHLYHDVG